MRIPSRIHAPRRTFPALCLPVFLWFAVTLLLPVSARANEAAPADALGEEELGKAMHDLATDEEVKPFRAWSWKDKPATDPAEEKHKPAAGVKADAKGGAAKKPATEELPPEVREAAPITEELVEPPLEDMKDVKAPPPPAVTPEPVVGKDGGAGQPAASALPAAPQRTGKYEDLVRENLDLRAAQEALRAEVERLKAENVRTTAQVKESEAKRLEMAALLGDARAGAESVAATEQKVKALETELRKVQADKELLARRIVQAESDLTASRTREHELAAAAASPEAGGGGATGVKAGSPLFAVLEKETLQLQKDKQALQEKLLAMEAAQREQTSSGVEAATAELRGQLREAQERRDREGKAVAKLARSATESRAEVDKLRAELKDKDAEISRKDEMLKAAATELRRRDWRMDYAGKTVHKLDEARSDVRRVEDREKVDMLYNMGVVHTEKGEFDSARKAYLRALDIAPEDPEIHYNLGLLYEEHFKDRERAAAHFKNYLKFKPEAEDADLVKSWLVDMDLKKP